VHEQLPPLSTHHRYAEPSVQWAGSIRATYSLAGLLDGKPPSAEERYRSPSLKNTPPLNARREEARPVGGWSAVGSTRPPGALSGAAWRVKTLLTGSASAIPSASMIHLSSPFALNPRHTSS